jgi:hypothetical protein
VFDFRLRLHRNRLLDITYWLGNYVKVFSKATEIQDSRLNVRESFDIPKGAVDFPLDDLAHFPVATLCSILNNHLIRNLTPLAISWAQKSSCYCRRPRLH